MPVASSRTVRAILACLMAFAHPAGSMAQAPVRAIVAVSDNIYRFQSDKHYGAFLVTAEGIVVADPIDTQTATWLKGELEKRFEVPVKYLLYSHFHADHAAGGRVFDGATVIAHANTARNLQPPAKGQAYQGYEKSLDTDGDGKLQRAETAANQAFASNFDAWDQDRDGGLDPRELFLGRFGEVRLPDRTFDGQDFTFSFGGQDITMHHVGGDHANDLSYIMFPGKTLFAVDLVNIEALPFGTLYGGYNRAEVDRGVDAAMALLPNVVMGGHGSVGTLSGAEAYRQYHVDLLVAVQAAIKAGQTLPEIQQSVKMEQYKTWANYAEWLPSNIEGMYIFLTGAR